MIIADILLTVVGIIGAIMCKAASKSYFGFSNKYDTYFWICLLMAAWGIISIIKYYNKKQKHNDEINNSNSSRRTINTKECPSCGMKNLSSDCTICPKCGKSIEQDRR